MKHALNNLLHYFVQDSILSSLQGWSINNQLSDLVQERFSQRRPLVDLHDIDSVFYSIYKKFTALFKNYSIYMIFPF